MHRVELLLQTVQQILAVSVFLSASWSIEITQKLKSVRLYCLSSIRNSFQVFLFSFFSFAFLMEITVASLSIPSTSLSRWIRNG